MLDNLDITIAGRYDDYNDFGEEFSPQVSVRWRPIDQLTVRASWGEGFKAPNLGDIGQELSQSFEFVTDFVSCEINGIARADCPNIQVETYVGGNPDLQAEQSESWNIGIVAAPLDNFEFSIDFWSIEIDEAVATLEESEVITFEASGTLPPGIIVNRGPAGNVLPCAGGTRPPNCGIINPFANLATLEVEGFDVRAQYDFETDVAGSFRAQLEYSQITTYDQQSTPIAPVFDLPGTEELPEFRWTGTLRWNYEAFTVNWNIIYIDEHGGGPIPIGAGEYDSYDRHDLNVTWEAPWGGEVSIGARNITDEDPILDDQDGWISDVSQDLYSVRGRVPYFSYRHFF